MVRSDSSRGRQALTFIDLPVGIQSKVWGLSWVPRLVRIETNSVDGGFCSRTPLPSSFHIHRASRAFSMTKYAPDQAGYRDTIPFFNPKLDTLVVSRPGPAGGFTAQHLSRLLSSISAYHVFLSRSLTAMPNHPDGTLDMELCNYIRVLVGSATVKSITFYREYSSSSWHIMRLVRYRDEQPPIIDIATMDPDLPNKWNPLNHSLTTWQFDPNPLSSLRLHQAIVFPKSTSYDSGWRLLIPIPTVSHISCELVWFLAIYKAWLERLSDTNRRERGDEMTRDNVSFWEEELLFMIDGICTIGLPGVGGSSGNLAMDDEIVDANFHYIADVMDGQVNPWWPNAKFQRQRAYRDAIKQTVLQNIRDGVGEPIETSQDHTDRAGWKRWKENLSRWRRTLQP